MIYGLECYGLEGAEKIIEILRNELIVCMQMMGVNSIKEIKSNMIVSKNYSSHLNIVPRNDQRDSTYSALAKL